jgi:hypothetical protein
MSLFCTLASLLLALSLMRTGGNFKPFLTATSDIFAVSAKFITAPEITQYFHQNCKQLAGL